MVDVTPPVSNFVCTSGRHPKTVSKTGEEQDYILCFVDVSKLVGTAGVAGKPKAFSVLCDGGKQLLEMLLKCIETTAAAGVGGSHPLHYLLFPEVANNRCLH